MKGARLATRQELDATTRRIKSRIQEFGKEKPERFAREAKARVDSFSRRLKPYM